MAEFITTDTRDEFGCLVEGETLPINTDDELAAARAALVQAGLVSAAVYAGDVDGFDSYATGAVLLARP